MPERRPEEKRGAESDISAFLEAHPTGPLTVAVGYASVRGLAWLARQTGARPVILVIGDCRAQHFTKASAADRDRVLRFLDRNDVGVKNWYRRRTEKSEAHLKVWTVTGGARPAALVGSANLTGAGLFRNREMVTAACEPDLTRVVSEIESLVSEAWDCKDRLRKLVAPPPKAKAESEPAPRTPPSKRRQPQASPSRPARGGCLSGALWFIAAAALACTAIAAFAWMIYQSLIL